MRNRRRFADTLNGSYLIAMRPLTLNGRELRYDEFGQPMYKEFHHLPLTARAAFEKRNQKLPPHLQIKLEEVRVTGPQAEEVVPSKQVAQRVAQPKQQAPQKRQQAPRQQPAQPQVKSLDNFGPQENGDAIPQGFAHDPGAIQYTAPGAELDI